MGIMHNFTRDATPPQQAGACHCGLQSCRSLRCCPTGNKPSILTIDHNSDIAFALASVIPSVSLEKSSMTCVHLQFGFIEISIRCRSCYDFPSRRFRAPSYILNVKPRVLRLGPQSMDVGRLLYEGQFQNPGQNCYSFSLSPCFSTTFFIAMSECNGDTGKEIARTEGLDLETADVEGIQLGWEETTSVQNR